VVNPFTLTGVQFPNGVQNLFTPRDGVGLNPLLQDWLMVIHPRCGWFRSSMTHTTRLTSTVKPTAKMCPRWAGSGASEWNGA